MPLVSPTLTALEFLGDCWLVPAFVLRLEFSGFLMVKVGVYMKGHNPLATAFAASERLLQYSRFFFNDILRSRVNLFHEIVDPGLAGGGPLPVMLAHDFGRVAENVCDILQ